MTQAKLLFCLCQSPKTKNISGNADSEVVHEPLFDIEEDEIENKPKLGEYWKINNGVNFLYAVISNELPLKAKFFAPTIKGNFFLLNETSFDVYHEDLKEKTTAPEVIQKGRNRTFYLFKN